MLAGCRCAIVARIYSLRAGILLCAQRTEANHIAWNAFAHASLLPRHRHLLAAVTSKVHGTILLA